MSQRVDRHWFFTWRTYGSWLPGHTGFVGNYVTPDGMRVTDNRYGEVAGPAMPALAQFAADSLKQPPVYLAQPQAERLLEQFRETASYRARVIDAVAILVDHIHLVFGTPCDPEPDGMLEDWKAYASRALNRMIAPQPPAEKLTWWARGGSTRILKALANRAGAIRYVRDQDRPLTLWLSDEATQLLEAYPAEVWADPR